jgi:hypothetical protein
VGTTAFADADVHEPAFLGRARSLGLSIEELRALLARH